MRNYVHIGVGIWLFASSLISAANTTLVLQVPETYHKNPVRLLHPFLNVWHNRADAAEKAGTAQLQAQNITVNSCASGAQGQALVVIEPNMFYNPKMGVFYSEITARVFLNASVDASLTAPTLTLKGKGQMVGNLNAAPEFFMQKAYAVAYDDVITQLLANETFNTSIVPATSKTYQALCTSIDTLSQPKLFF